MNPPALESYRRALAAAGCTLREDSLVTAGMPELEWQTRWFAGEFGCEWQSVDGVPIRMLDFGRWNREPGPDFVEARLCIGSREVRGAVELDPEARDWEHHGHAVNPAYREVVLHVFMEQPARRFFTRTVDHREVTQLHLSPGLVPKSAHAAEPFEPIDTDAMLPILHAAARHRLDLKARSLRRCAAVHGESDAWFAALAAALGYKRNQIPFQLLAQRVGQGAAANAGGEALLFGTAGFLESPAPPDADHSTRAYLRDLWEAWWSVRAGCERWILPSDAWQMGGARPANHPHRRVAALARIAGNWAAIHNALVHSRRESLIAALEALDHPFWSSRFNLWASPLPGSQALVGAERIRDIVINIFYPLAIDLEPGAWQTFLAEKGPATAAFMRNTAQRFFGEVPPSSLSAAAIQQGLLQLEKDWRAAPEPREFITALRRMA
jgi:Protein of unknown function (DUF2851)